MDERRTYRVANERAPRLLFELSRIGTPLASSTESERYRCGDAIVSLDHVVPPGWSCVITAENGSEIDAVAERLGLHAEYVEARDPAELLQDTEAKGPQEVRAPRVPPGVSSPSVPARNTARRLLIGAAGFAVAILIDPMAGVVVAVVLLLLDWAFATPKRGEELDR